MSTDAGTQDVASAGDAAYPMVDGPEGLPVVDPVYVAWNFQEMVTGTWLIGYFGGQDHFSWLRLLPDGKAQVLSDPSIVSVGVPLWPCNGSAAWGPTARPETLGLEKVPAGCERMILTFSSFRPVSRPERAVLQADISLMSLTDAGYSAPVELVGYKFPDDFCDPNLTTCPSPY